MGRWSESPILTAVLAVIMVGGMVAAAAAAITSEHPAAWGRGSGSGEEVALALNFNRLEAVSMRDGLPLAEAFRRMKAAGVSSLVIQERNLVELEARGDVQVRWGRELLDDLRLTSPGTYAGDGPSEEGPIPPGKFLIRTPHGDLHRWLKTALDERWHAPVEEWSHPVSGETWLSITVPAENPVDRMARRNRHRYEFSFDDEELPFDLMHLPLGFRGEDFETALAAGLQPIVKLSAAAPPPPAPPGSGGDGAWLRGVLGPAVELPASTLIIPGDRGLPGGWPWIEPWAQFLSESEWNLGVVRGRSFPGEATLAEALPRQLVPVHPVWPDEPEQRTVDAVARGRARVLTFDWFMTLEGRRDDAGVLPPAKIEAMAARLEGAGFVPGAEVSPLRGAGSSLGMGILIAGSLAAASALLLLRSRGPGEILAGGAVGAAALAIVPGFASPLLPLLLSAAVFTAPAAALVGGVNIAAALSRHRKGMPGDRALPVPASLAGAAAGMLVAVLGGVAVSALMVHPLYRAGLASHRSILLAGAAAAALAAFITRNRSGLSFPVFAFHRGESPASPDAGSGAEVPPVPSVPAEGEEILRNEKADGSRGGAGNGNLWAGAFSRGVDGLKRIAAQPITFGHLAAAGILAVIVFTVVYRAVNMPFLPEGPRPPGGSPLDLLLRLAPGVPETGLGVAALYFSLRWGGPAAGGVARALGLAAAAGFAGLVLTVAKPTVPLAISLEQCAKGFAAGLAIIGLISFARFLLQRGGNFSPDGGFYDAEP